MDKKQSKRLTIWVYRRLPYLKKAIYIPFRRKIPRTWDQVTQKQALMYAMVLNLNKHDFSQDIPFALQMQILNLWLRITQEEFYRLTDFQVSYILSEMDEVFQSPKTIPRYQLKIKRNKYYLPSELLVGETAEGFAVYEEYYSQILSGENAQESLSLFCAYLLRKRNTEVDTQSAEALLAHLMSVSDLEKYYIFWWYYCNRAQLVAKYQGAFGKGSARTGGPDFTSGFGWFGLIFSIAQDGPFGDEKMVRKTDLHDFLTYLDFNHGRSKEMEWRMKMNSNGTT